MYIFDNEGRHSKHRWISITGHQVRGEKDNKREMKVPEVVFREGKPRAVVLDIEEYQDMLERLEDLEYLKMLERTRKETP